MVTERTASDPPRRVQAFAVDVATLGALIAFFIVAQSLALDYGDGHPDEPRNVEHLAWALTNRVPFPEDYVYPGALVWVQGAAAGLDVLLEGPDAVAARVHDRPFVMRARMLLVLLSSLVVCGTWGMARAIGASRTEAWFAAALVATSWQLGLHARFIANDAMVACTSSLTLAAALLALRDRRPALLYAAAALGGVATGFKYTPAVLAVVGVLVAWRIAEPGRRARVVLTSAALFVAGFFVTTPGVVFEPSVVWRAIEFDRVVYRGGWLGYTVDGPAGLLTALVGWVVFAALAKPTASAVVLAGFAVVGSVSCARAFASRLLLLYAALVVGTFFVGNVFLSRQFLTLIPVLAVAAARGLSLSCARLPRPVSGVLIALVIATGAFSTLRAAWVSRPSVTVDGAGARAALADHLADHADTLFVGSPQVRSIAGGAHNVVAHDDARAAQAQWLLAMPHELFVAHEWPANQPFLIARVFGPEEIDFRYSPSWSGRARVLLLSVDRARAAGAALDFAPRAHAPPPRMPFEMIER